MDADTFDVKKLEILDTITELEEFLSEASEAVEEANSSASEAEDQAMYAKDNACEAENAAYRARSRCDDAENAISNVDEKIKEILEMVENLDHEGKTVIARDLKAEIKKWMPRVRPQLDNGSTHSHIASNLGISEFLVQCIEDKVKEERGQEA